MSQKKPLEQVKLKRGADLTRELWGDVAVGIEGGGDG